MKTSIKKYLAVFLAMLMLLSSFPALAGSTGSVASDLTAGTDTAQSAQTTYGESGIGTSQADVYLTIDSNNIVVGVPTTVIVSGTPTNEGKYIGAYSVTVSGDIAGNQMLVVEPDSDTIELSQSGKNDVPASINQLQTRFYYADLASNTVTTGSIEAQSLTAGSWSGAFNFNISLANRTVYTYSQMNTPVTNYINNVTYDPSDYTTSEISNYVYSSVSYNGKIAVGKTIALQAGELTVTDYNSGISYTENVSAGDYTFYNITPGVGGEFVVKDNNGTVVQEGVLNPTGQLRSIETNTLNVRDLGGWRADGGTVKYGMLYRGALPSSSDAGVLVDQLGVATEMDLRGTEESTWTESPLGTNVDFYVFDNYVWYNVSNKELWHDMLEVVFDCVASNKPLYFHCSAGADRTATLACVIEALLGMSESDIDKDYELTCFYSGVDTDAKARRRNESQWTGLINALNAYPGNTITEKAVAFCLDIGFSLSDINNFRNTMIDGAPAQYYSVTNNLSNARNTNNSIIVANSEGYEVTIVPSNGYDITSINVIMGGTDVTSSAVTMNNGNAVISILNITGNITITVNTQGNTVNLLTMNDGLINKRIPTNGTPSNSNGYFVTDYIPFDSSQSTGFRIVNGVSHIGSLGATTLYGDCKLVLYDSSKNIICQWYMGRTNTGSSIQFVADGNDLVRADLTTNTPPAYNGTLPSDWTNVKYVRFGLALNNASAAISSVSDVTGSNLAIYAE